MSVHTSSHDVLEPETTGTVDGNPVIGVFSTHAEAEDAVRKLEKSGFDMKQLSIIGRDYHTEDDVVGYYTLGDKMKAWGGLGAFWGGMWRLLFGSAFFIIPDVGPLLVAGPFVAMIVGALENSAVVGGLSAFGAALFSIGVPKDSVVHYESQIKAGRFVVVVHPFGGEPTKAKQILESTSHDSVTHH